MIHSSESIPNRTPRLGSPRRMRTGLSWILKTESSLFFTPVRWLSRLVPSFRALWPQLTRGCSRKVLEGQVQNRSRRHQCCQRAQSGRVGSQLVRRSVVGRSVVGDLQFDAPETNDLRIKSCSIRVPSPAGPSNAVPSPLCRRRDQLSDTCGDRNVPLWICAIARSVPDVHTIIG